MSEWQAYPPEPGNGNHTVVGNIKMLKEVHSPQLGNERDVLAYLPPSYARGDRRYPVIYMHDGQNLFDQATSFGEEWKLDNTMEAVSRRGLEAIVVGIPNAGASRCDEYSPFVDPKHGGGKGDLYLDFIVETLKPLIDRDFRTLTDREHTGIAGSSMGGLISLYGFFRRPEVFGIAGVMSPSFWFANRAVFPYIEVAPFVPGKIYLDCGTQEGPQTLADVRRMRWILQEKGYRPRHDLFYVEEVGAGHHEAAWSRRIRKAVPFFLRRVRQLG